MKLIKLFISITAKGMIAYSEQQSLAGTGVLGATRLVRFNNKAQATDESIWLFTEYTKDDFQTLVESGYDVMYIDTESGNHHTQSQVDAMNASDYSIGTPATSNDSVDTFTD